MLSTTSPEAETSDILWLRTQILLSAGQLKTAHELLVREGTGGSLARDWYRMTGIQEIAKRVESSGSAVDVNEESEGSAWVWETELGEFLDTWSKDTEA